MFEIAESTGSGSPASSPRARRRAETTQEILDAAWELARRDGVVGISLRELGKRVGLKASSLYAYFDSKAALYDAMYRQAYRELLDAAAAWQVDGEALADPHRVFAHTSREFFRLCVDDPARYQLLFQRTVPDWEPSPESYALATAYVGLLHDALARIGVTDERAIDMWTAIVTGLTSQQISNDPGGDRWLRLVDDAVEMFFTHYPPDPPAAAPATIDQEPTT